MIISGDAPVSKGARRFEVFTGAGKRRDWSDAQKASIVAECWPGGERVTAVARRHALDLARVLKEERDILKKATQFFASQRLNPLA
jgi:transposase